MRPSATAPLALAAALGLLSLGGPLGPVGAAAGAAAESPAGQPPSRLTFDDLFEEGRAGRSPSQLAWTPDGSALGYLWDDGSGEALWRMDGRSGEAERLLAVEELPGGDDGGSIDAWQWSPDGADVLLEAGGDLFLWGAQEGLARLTDTAAAEEAPSFSPDGVRIAFVREADLYLLELDAADGDGERALTTDGEPGEILNGTTSWVYWEEIWSRNPTGYWWSPDGERIAYYRFDETPVGEFTLLPDPVALYPEPKVQRYPKAGTANPEARLGVLHLASGETTWLETGTDQETYPAPLHWPPDGGAVAVERLNREQTELDLLLCSPVTGACRTILEERHPTWINLGRETTFLGDGRLLWASERSGWRHLYLYRLPGAAGGSAEGAPGGPEQRAELVRQLTSGGWAVTSLDHAGSDAAVVTAHGTGPLGAATRRVLRVPYDGSEPVELAAGDPEEGSPGAAETTGPGGWHTARVAPGGERWVHGWSDADHPGWQRIEAMDGGVVAALPSEPPAFEPGALPVWRFFRIPADGDGTSGGGAPLPAALLLPSGVEADGEEVSERPVLMYHYGCPGSQVVADRWSSGRGLWHKMMAQRGFPVLMVDNRGSAFFGKAGEDRAYRRFGEGNLEAQLRAVQWLGGRPFVDPERIGLWGWSGGGSNTLYALLGAPGTWRAGVAGAPVTDWRYYDTIWTERYLDHPDDNPEGYEASSAVTYAGALADELLIVHGTADDNVHPNNTLAMADALTAEGKPFAMAIYPGQKHGFRGDAERHFYERMTDFFERTLKGD